MQSAIFRLKDISKTFPGVRALSHVDFDLMPGEIHCICGENGAGKSTLIKIISGAYQPDPGGAIEFEGEDHSLTPHSAIELGIQTIYQEHNIFPHLSVTENIFAGLEITRGAVIDHKEMRAKTKEVLAYLHCGLNPDDDVGEFTPGQKRMVEIAKALVFKRKIIILDEPTASFSASEIDLLLDVVKKVASTGLAIVYISHHLDEVFRIADRVTVLRDGDKIVTCSIDEINEQQLIRYMVGRDVSAFYSRKHFEPGEVVLEAKNLSGNGVKNISFTVRRGEIVGFSGIIGSGRSELMTLLMGGAPKEGGDLYLFGEKVNLKSPSHAIRHKMCYITEDRQHTGLFLSHPIARNATVANLVNLRKKYINPKEDIKVSNGYIKKLGIKARNAHSLITSLSGGNQQKVVLAKWFHTNGEIFIFDEPTRGIDVGAKQEVYQIMTDLLRQNKAVIMVSSDMPEVISMSDRVFVMKGGCVQGEIHREDISEENILQLSIGGSSL